VVSPSSINASLIKPSAGWRHSEAGAWTYGNPSSSPRTWSQQAISGSMPKKAAANADIWNSSLRPLD
jgi:hypothetical protein